MLGGVLCACGKPHQSTTQDGHAQQEGGKASRPPPKQKHAKAGSDADEGGRWPPAPASSGSTREGGASEAEGRTDSPPHGVPPACVRPQRWHPPVPATYTHACTRGPTWVTSALAHTHTHTDACVRKCTLTRTSVHSDVYPDTHMHARSHAHTRTRTTQAGGGKKLLRALKLAMQKRRRAGWGKRLHVTWNGKPPASVYRERTAL